MRSVTRKVIGEMRRLDAIGGGPSGASYLNIKERDDKLVVNGIEYEKVCDPDQLLKTLQGIQVPDTDEEWWGAELVIKALGPSDHDFNPQKLNDGDRVRVTNKAYNEFGQVGTLYDCEGDRQCWGIACDNGGNIGIALEDVEKV